MSTTKNWRGVPLGALAAVAIGAVAIPPALSAERRAGEAVLIKTHITFGPHGAAGEVRPGSFIGDSAFCRDGRFRDRPADGALIKKFRCSDGRLKIRFHPHGQSTQSGPWKVVGGSGRFEGLRGRGWMVFEPAGDREGRETFTGRVAG